MSKLEIKNLEVTYLVRKEERPALKGVSLLFPSNSINVILGESGSGKSTILRAILEQFAYDGEIYLDDVEISKVKHKDKNFAYVDQQAFLFKHMIVYDILAYPLKQLKIKYNKIDEMIKEVAEIFSITPLLTRKPDQLSIGETKRVSLARAFIKNPSICLFDEPLAGLSPEDKEEIITYIKNVKDNNEMTIIYVTHDYNEAIKLAENVFVINNGVVEFSGTKEDLISNTSNDYINNLRRSSHYEL